MANIVFQIITDSAGAVIGVQKYSQALATLGPTAAAQSNQATTAFNRIEATLNKAKSAVIGFIAAVAFAKIIREFIEVMGAAARFEEQMSNVKKTVSGTDEQFNKLSDSLKAMSLTLPTSLEDLTSIATIAGQLGIPVGAIDAFTEIIAKLGVTTGLSADELATAFGTIASVTGLTADKFMTFGSVLTRLGNEFNATEGQILHFAVEMAGTTHSFKVPEQTLLALGTAMASVGLRAEAAGSSLRKVFSTIATSAEQGGEKLEIFGKIAHNSAGFTGNFAELAKKDMAEAFRVFISGFGAMNLSGGKQIEVLKDLGLGNERVQKLVLQLAGGFEVLNSAIAAGNDEVGKTNAIEEEVRKKMETVMAQAGLLRNAFELLAIQISEPFMDSIMDAVTGLQDFTKGLMDEDNTLRRTVIAGFHAFKITVDGFVIEPIHRIIGLFQMFPELGAMALKGIQIMATGLVRLTDYLVDASNLFTIFWDAAARQSRGDTIGAIAVLTSGLKGFTSTAAHADAVALEFQKILNDLGQTAKGTQEKFAIYGPTLLQLTKNFKDTDDAAGDMGDGLGEVDKAAAAFTSQVDNMFKSLNKNNNELAALIAVLKRADKAHIDSGIVIETFGKQILEAESRTMGLTDADSNLIKVKADLVRIQQAATKEADDAIKSMEEYNKEVAKQTDLMYKSGTVFGDYTDWLNYSAAVTLKNTLNLEDLNKQLEEHANLMNTQVKQLPLFPIEGGEVDAPGPMPSGLPVDEKELKAIMEAGTDVVDQIINDISRMFKNAIGHGKSFWEAFKTMGMGAIASVADVLFKDLLHGFLDQFKETFGRWQLNFQKWIKDTLVPMLGKAIDGVTVALTAIGATIGGWLGSKKGHTAAGAVAAAAAGFAIDQASKGNLIAAGIAAAVAAVAGLVAVFSSGLHLMANKFVQDFQNPMTDAVGSLFDSLTAAKDAGTLTAKQVGDASTALEKMWTDFQANAAQSGVVGEQAIATMTPFMASWREWLVGLGLAADELEVIARAEAHRAAVTGVVEKVTGAATGWEALEQGVQELMDTGMDWGAIVKFLGGDIRDMADRMKALGMTIPPAMQSILDVMDAFDATEKAAKKAAKELEKC